MSMHLLLMVFVGAWLLFWAIVLGYALLSRLEGERHSLTLFDDSRTELFATQPGAAS
jgi:hypothetical protein